MKSIYIYGASGHGLVVADIARACGYKEILLIDDGENEYPSFETIIKDTNTPVALGIGQNHIRKKIFDKLLQCGFEIATLVHPAAIISSSAIIKEGTVIMPNAVVNAKALIGKGVILNTACIIEHECSIDDFVHISPNVALSGNVTVGQLTHIGIGTQVIQGVLIGENSIIGAGSTIVKNISNNKLCYGSPCMEVKELV